jgi:hypothetical protein
MKILVLGQPRQGTTKLCGVLASMFGLKDYNEQIHNADGGAGQDMLKMSKAIQQLKNDDNFCVKLFPIIENQEIDWAMFDLIVTTSRNKADSIISLFIAQDTGKYIKRTYDYEWGDLAYFILPWSRLKGYAHIDYNARREQIIGRTLPNFTYDEICNDDILIEKIKNLGFPIVNHTPVVSSLPTGNDYKEKCVNYTLIEKVVCLAEEHTKLMDAGWESIKLYWQTIGRVELKSIRINYQHEFNVIKKSRKPFIYNLLAVKHRLHFWFCNKKHQLKFFLLKQKQNWYQIRYRFLISTFYVRNILK